MKNIPQNGANFTRFFKAPVGALRRLLARRDPAECFLLLQALGLFVFLLRALLGGSGVFVSIFREDGALFADFFNSVRDAAAGSAAYSERRVIYPPLANALLWLLSRLLPAAYFAAPTAAWYRFPAAVLLFFVFFSLSLVLLALTLASATAHRRARVALALTASLPVLFLIERGNLVVLALTALLLFAGQYRSNSPAKRECAMLALGIAVALKLYPAVFALPLVRERRWRDLMRAAAYAAALYLLPSFFFGGPLFCARWLIKNTLYYSGHAGAAALQQMSELVASRTLATVALCGAYLLGLAFLVLFALLQKRAWRVFALAAAFLLSIPSIFSCYNWVLFFPALISLFATERLRGLTLAWFFAMTTPLFLYLAKPYQDHLHILLLATMTLLALWESISILRQRRNGTERAK